MTAPPCLLLPPHPKFTTPAIPIHSTSTLPAVRCSGYQSQIIYNTMASRAAKRNDTGAPCPSRRVKSSDKRTDKCLEKGNSACEMASSDPHNQIEQHKQEEIKSKNEKESTSLPNHDLPDPHLLRDKHRRVTRSLISTYKHTPDLDAQAELLTPEDNFPTKLQEEPTLKKVLIVSSAQQLGESLVSDVSMTVRKAGGRASQLLVSPFKEYRKSYRKTSKRQIISIPYRKCHDPLEGRIVSIINKVEADKNWLKDLEGLIEKMQRIGLKDMMNKYIVAGIRTIIKTARLKTPESPILDKLEHENRKLQLRIVQELESLQGFLPDAPADPPQQDCRQYRLQLIRKVYRIYRRRYHHMGCAAIKAKALKDCDKLLQQPHCSQKLLNFVRAALSAAD